jgi:hypothetical protein
MTRVTEACVLGVAAVLAVAAIGGAATASAKSVPTAPLPFLQCPAGDYQATSGDCVPSPNQSPQDSPFMCRDGTYSHSEGRQGACSHHGGIAP